MSILETHDLVKRYGDLVAVNAVNLSVEAGETFGLVGPNGAGKTTVIKMLTTLLPPTSGTAIVDGYDVVRQAAQVRRILGYVPQMLSADGTLTGAENLMVFAKLYDISRRDRGARVREALGFMGLEDAADRLVREYSGGMIRRLEIAQAMLHRPRVLFLDEPTLGLDPLARKAVWQHIERLRADWQTTIILTTHYMDEADSLCDRVAIMHDGNVVIVGAPANLKASTGDPHCTLDDVFVYYAGGEIEESGGGYVETSRTRRAASRLG
jgi:ABC-2 type transport system ATP-binding protein